MDSPAALAGRTPGTRVAGLSAAILPARQTPTGELAALLANPALGLVGTDSFRVNKYSPKLAADYVGTPDVSVGFSNFGSFVGGGTALHFSDILDEHDLTLAAQTSSFSTGGFVKNLAGMGIYLNQQHRWSWGLLGGQVPFVYGNYGETVGNLNGTPVLVQQTQTLWQFDRQLLGLLQYPFNRAQRVEFSAGFESIGFSAQQGTAIFDLSTGAPITAQLQNLPTPHAINLATGGAALVYDTAIFGGTSPVIGQRYRLEAGADAGTLSFTTALADYRRYFQIARPLSVAGRLMHYGRYGGGANDDRLQSLFVGDPYLIRGYDVGSFTPAECGPAFVAMGACPAFDRLLGNRIAVGNLETRLQLLGPLGVISSPSLPPVELAPFYDAGVAWTSLQKASFLGGTRHPVTSYGTSLRFNILGYAIGQLSYVHPNDRPLKHSYWEFDLLPGF
jgi:hypothetical protein